MMGSQGRAQERLFYSFSLEDHVSRDHLLGGVDPHKTDEVQSTKTMIDRVERQVRLKPKRLVGDMAYGAAPLLNWIVNDKRIARDAYTCPGDKKLKTTGRATSAETLLYRATNTSNAS